MRIGFILPNLQAGGGNRSQVMLANGLADRGYEVSIIVPKGSVSDIPVSIKPRVYEKGMSLRSCYLNALVNYLLIAFSLYSYDVIIVTFSIMTWYVFIPFTLYKLKAFHFARHYDPLLLDQTHISSELLRRIYKYLSRSSYELPFHLLVNSQWTGRTISENTIKKTHYDIINNGVDLTIFKPCEFVKVENCSHKRIFTIGKKQRWKGLYDLIAALQIFSKDNKNFELVIATPNKLNIEQNTPFKVRITQPKDDGDIVEAYQEADIFVSSSWYEGFGNPPLEAMACGTPVALTDSGGVREYAIHNYNCVMSPPRQPEKLAENIKSILQDKKLALRLVRNGLETARKFTWEKSVDKFEKILIQRCKNKAIKQ